MHAKISVFVICVEATIYFLSHILRDCTFKRCKGDGKFLKLIEWVDWFMWRDVHVDDGENEL